MLFRKSIDPRCSYCLRGVTLEDGRVLCARKGIMEAGLHCRSFTYDPLKRRPPAPAVPDFSRLEEEDFTL